MIHQIAGLQKVLGHLRRSFANFTFVTAVVVGSSALSAAADDDVPLIADVDIETLLEQELNNLNVDDFYLLEHLIDIDIKVKAQQARMDAIRGVANRISSGSSTATASRRLRDDFPEKRLTSMRTMLRRGEIILEVTHVPASASRCE